MLKKSMFGLGLIAIGVMCMMMNSTGNVIFYSPGNDFNGWDLHSPSPGTTVETAYNVGHTGQYSLKISSPYPGSHRCSVDSPTMTGFSSTTRYIISFEFYLPSYTINGFHMLYNGQVNLMQNGGTLVAYGNGWSQNIVSNMTTGEHTMFIDVNGPGLPNGYHYKIAYDDGSPISAKFWLPTAYNVVSMGDDELGSTYYGTMYYDQLRIYHISTYNDSLKNNDLFEEFSEGKLDTYSLNPWTIVKDSGSTATGSTDWNRDFYSVNYGIHINCPANKKAYATTPPNPAFNKSAFYSISMWIRLPASTSNNFFIVLNNQEIFLFMSHGNVLHWATQYGNGHLFTMAYNQWYFLKCVIDPAQHKYNVYIDNNKVSSPPIDVYYANTYSAWNFLGIGIDAPNTSNYGELYWDDIKIAQP